MILLILRDLQFRKWRVLLTMLLMAIVMTLLFIMAGVVGQMSNESAFAVDQIGGERNWIVAAGSSGPLTTPQTLPSSTFEPVEVNDANLVLTSQVALNGFQGFLVASEGTDLPPLIEGRSATAPGEVVVDATTELSVGDRVDLNGIAVDVVGISDDTTIIAGLPLVFSTLSFGQEVATAGEDLVTALTTASSPEVPAALRLMTADMVASDARIPVEAALSSITLINGLLWLMTVIIVTAVIYVAALERTRDFAVLKAVGARTRDLGASLLVQGVVMTVGAFAIAAVLQRFIGPAFPLALRMQNSSWIQIFVTAVVASALAALGGIQRMRSISPAEAFS